MRIVRDREKKRVIRDRERSSPELMLGMSSLMDMAKSRVETGREAITRMVEAKDKQGTKNPDPHKYKESQRYLGETTCIYYVTSGRNGKDVTAWGLVMADSSRQAERKYLEAHPRHCVIKVLVTGRGTVDAMQARMRNYDRRDVCPNILT